MLSIAYLRVKNLICASQDTWKAVMNFQVGGLGTKTAKLKQFVRIWHRSERSINLKYLERAIACRVKILLLVSCTRIKLKASNEAYLHGKFMQITFYDSLMPFHNRRRLYDAELNQVARKTACVNLPVSWVLASHEIKKLPTKFTFSPRSRLFRHVLSLFRQPFWPLARSLLWTVRMGSIHFSVIPTSPHVPPPQAPRPAKTAPRCPTTPRPNQSPLPPALPRRSSRACLASCDEPAPPVPSTSWDKPCQSKDSLSTKLHCLCFAVGVSFWQGRLRVSVSPVGVSSSPTLTSLILYYSLHYTDINDVRSRLHILVD